MRCDYFDTARCRSCGLMGVPYARQVHDKQRQVQDALAGVAADVHWLEAFAGPESGYRNKAKWVVGGSLGAPTIGILDEFREGIDLRRCGICEPALTAAFPVLADFIASCGLIPYDVQRRSGEIKYLIVTAAPGGALMVRFVLRSSRHLETIREALPDLLGRLPHLAVVSVNLHPEHKAVLDGETEILLTDRPTLPMRLNGITLHLGPRAFFQTNTEVAAALYRRVTNWSRERAVRSVLDMYCGVGGFALHVGAAGAETIRGIEVSADAVIAARRSAAELPDPGRFAFDAGDATEAPTPAELEADLVVVNPPRRGIGPELASVLERTARTLVYSSCNPASLATDLSRMPSLRPVQAQLFDMFPQTTHSEVAVLLERTIR